MLGPAYFVLVFPKILATDTNLTPNPEKTAARRDHDLRPELQNSIANANALVLRRFPTPRCGEDVRRDEGAFAFVERCECQRI